MTQQSWSVSTCVNGTTVSHKIQYENILIMLGKW